MFIPPSPFLFSKLESRSASAENPTGRRGFGGRKYLHYRTVAPGETLALADLEGQGIVRGFWLTVSKREPVALRSFLIRMYWDGSAHPSVEAPLGDFFGLAHGRVAHYSTPYLGVSEGKGFYTFFPMPFSRHCRIEFFNDAPDLTTNIYWQINFTLGDKITPDMGRFHALFRRDTPPRGTCHVILDTRNTPGVYVGTVISALPRSVGTWREGEFRFYIDGENDGCSIVGTGWSDWFLSGWGLGIHQSLYAGSNYQVKHPEYGDKYYCSCYRFHVLDPVYFRKSLRVEHTQHGIRPVGDGYEVYEREDDWCSVAYWYQRMNGQPFPVIPSREQRIGGIAIQPWEGEAVKRMRSGVDRVTDTSGPEVWRT